MKSILLTLAVASLAVAAPLRYAGAKVTATVLQVSDHTVEVRLAPPVDQTSLTRYDARQKWQGPDLTKPLEFALGTNTVTLTAAPVTLTIKRRDGKVVQRVTWSETDDSLTFRTEAPVFGLGEGGQGFDRRGLQFPLVDGWGVWNRPVYGSRISVPFAIGADGWGLFIGDLPGQKGEFDLRDRKQGVFRGIPANRVFLMAAEKPAQMVLEYARLTGKPPLPPKWALGYLQSHRTLDGFKDVMDVAKTYRDKQLPCDGLIYLGTGYCPSGWNKGHGSIEFNEKNFDNPKQNVKDLQGLNFKVLMHVNRAPKDMHGNSIDETPDGPTHIASYWARHQTALDAGVDAWWPDDGDELPQEARIARHRVYFEGSLKARPNERPWALHRTGYAGVQRYGGWIWTGDTESRWATLAAHVPIGQNHSVSLTPFWGFDIGGFFPTGELTGEQYVRWFQFGAFVPSFRGHGRAWRLRLPWGWNTGEFGPREVDPNWPHSFPSESELHNAAVEPICREYLNLRYRLLPYNYTLAREAHDTGIPMIRPLWFYYPVTDQGSEYLWGRDILVAPVTEKGATERAVYLPPGEWYDWWTGEKQAGGREVRRKVDLKTMPLYIRAGALLPLDPVRQYTAQAVSEPTTIQVYSGADSQFRLYDDDGKTNEYLKGQGTWTGFAWNDARKQLSIAAGGPARTFNIRVLPQGIERKFAYSGKAATVKF